MRKLTIDTVAQDGVDPRTTALRYDHPVMGRWFPTTQAWRWRGGDALVVVTGEGSFVQCWVALRLGDKLHAVAAQGVSQALATFGYETQVKQR